MLTRPKHCVSTHSRPKAAGRGQCHDVAWRLVSTHSRPKAAGCFNSKLICFKGFQHTAARRRLIHARQAFGIRRCFNTQPPEGGCRGIDSYKQRYPSFNTQPPEGGCSIWMRHSFFLSSFNTQPPEGGCRNLWPVPPDSYCFNTQPPEGGWRQAFDVGIALKRVSTHSRPKAAVLKTCRARKPAHSFNTQPPEGG